mgnify:CR=1 FL=1
MKKTGFLLASLAASLMATSALAQDISVKIGVLNDRSGIYADLAGEGSVIAARMAVEDFGAAEKGIKVEIVSADHQNKPDVASTISRQWLDQDGVNAIVDVPTSSAALAVNEIVKEANAVFINSGAAASDLTGPACSPHTVHWTYDTWALANGTGSAMVQQGGDSWFFLTADYAFGHALERDTSAVVEKAGGTVVGAVRHPFPGTDFSSFLLQAQASGAKVIGFAVLVTFGWLNRRHLVPIAERAAAPLIRSLRWEVLVAAMVLTVTAVLIEQPPGRTAVDRPFAATVTADDATLQVTVEPARTGPNDLHLYFYNAVSGEVLPVDAVEVTAGTTDIPPRRLDVVPITASHVSVLGATFTAVGTWDIAVTLVRAGQPTTFILEVPIR